MYDALISGLKECGIDTEGALRRFSGLADLYGKYLLLFPSDDNFAKIGPALDSDSYEDALKGVSGNMGMTRLYQACSETVLFLRSKKYPEAKASYGEVKAAYDEVCGAIEKLKG